MIILGTNPHGTRVIQKVIEVLNTEELLNSFISIFKPNIVHLFVDINGNHIIHKFLNSIDSIMHNIIYEAIGENIIYISSHKNGCCVLQRCIESAVTNMQVRFILLINFRFI